MQFTPHGAQHFPAAFNADQIARLARFFADADPDRPGTRLASAPGLERHIAPATDIARQFLGPAARPVRATLFDKSAQRNWALGWHQDRTIAVRERIEVPGFGHWTIKSGIHHVMPPVDLLERMLTLRIHLDRVSLDNAPLLIVPRSHRLGHIAEPEISPLVERLGTAACPAEAGDVWLYATLILHASAAAAKPARRRVLQLLYGADDLPGGLEWLGI
ncbi:MAG TPA: phytanoyl-CoA dioxygenase family protein [Allosphingosinicella sp.]|jgi:hypothetical protein